MCKVELSFTTGLSVEELSKTLSKCVHFLRFLKSLPSCIPGILWILPKQHQQQAPLCSSHRQLGLWSFWRGHAAQR